MPICPNCKCDVVRYGRCHRCANERARERRLANPDRYRAHSKAYRAKDAEDKRARARQYRLEHIDESRKSSRRYFEKNKEQILEVTRQRNALPKQRQRNKEMRHEHYVLNKAERLARTKKYFEEHPEKLCAYSRKRYRTNIHSRLASLLRGTLHRVLDQKTETDRTFQLLGCTVAELKLHLERRWTEGMTWGNYGREGWHIDHIKPCASFDFSNEEDRRACFHYTNLQPLWASENRSKGSRYPN